MSRSFLASLLWVARCLCFVIACLSFVTTAEAADPPKVFTLRVDGFDDPGEVQRKLADELAVSFVPPERANEATGELEVRYDGASKRVSVRFRKLGEPVTREVSAPAGELEARRAAILLSGNVARGGGGETEPAPKSAPTPGPDQTDLENQRKLDTLERLLKNEAATEDLRIHVGIAALAVGPAMVVSSFALTDYDDARALVSSTGAAFTGFGIALLLPIKGPIANLREAVRTTRGGGGNAEAAAAVLEAKAIEARSLRKMGGAAAMAIGLGVATAGGVLAFSDLGPHRLQARGWSAALLVGGSTYSLLGFYTFLAPSPVERVNASYKAAFPTNEVSVRPLLAPTRGGGLIGITGTF